MDYLLRYWLASVVREEEHCIVYVPWISIFWPSWRYMICSVGHSYKGWIMAHLAHGTTIAPFFMAWCRGCEALSMEHAMECAVIQGTSCMAHPMAFLFIFIKNSYWFSCLSVNSILLIVILFRQAFASENMSGVASTNLVYDICLLVSLFTNLHC